MIKNVDRGFYKIAISDKKGTIKGMNYDFVDYLKNKFQERCHEDPNFSLRKFAKELDLTSGQLSVLFTRTRNVSRAMFKRLAKHFKLSKEEIEKFSVWIENTIQGKATFSEFDFDKVLPMIVSQAIKIEKFSQNPGLLGKIIGVSREEIQGAVDDLLSRGVIQRSDLGSYFLNEKNILSSCLSPENVQVVFQYLTDCILKYPQVQTSYRYAFMPVNTEKLSEYKQKIEELYSQFIYWSGQNNEKSNKIYQFGIGFCPQID